MKRIGSKVMRVGALMILSVCAFAQKDEARMTRDLEVAKNILGTLLKQKLEKRNFFPLEVESNYREGYGVTFRMPMTMPGTFAFGFGGDNVTVINGQVVKTWDFMDEQDVAQVYDANGRILSETVSGRAKAPRAKPINTDSVYEATNLKIIEACKEFMADYGDLISQLQPNERIVITNREDGARSWLTVFPDNYKTSFLSVEVLKSELTQLKQGKVSREQFMKNLKVVNSEMDNKLQPDLELLSSIFNRLYRRDLSKTFFTDEGIYYERLKDYGVIYYMTVFSSNQSGPNRWIMPTQGLNNLTQAERDKRIKEIYPVFEQDIKLDLLEYGRTLKSLAPQEQLVFNIRLTKCQGCGIPATLELTVKASVLSDYASGKISRDAALAKIELRKGSIQ
ncbi:MAG: hypothetical protein KF775_09690 [Cyclobacteriaceae bacterium]|nr:hypothetical protein [Cytophagales bacterium]MBX2899914.1 hypothetical protein [Cyclobacteriaceae bacterium]